MTAHIDMPPVISAPFADGVMIAGHSLTGQWFQILDREEAAALVESIVGNLTD